MVAPRKPPAKPPARTPSPVIAPRAPPPNPPPWKPPPPPIRASAPVDAAIAPAKVTAASAIMIFRTIVFLHHLPKVLWTHCGSPARTSSQSDQQSHAAVTSGNQSIPDAQLTNELFSDLKVSTATARDVAARLICKKSLCCAQTRFDPKSFAKGRDRWRSLGNKARALKQIASNSRLVDEALLGYASQRKCLPVFTSTTEETSPACAEALVRVHSAPACHHG